MDTIPPARNRKPQTESLLRTVGLALLPAGLRPQDRRRGNGYARANVGGARKSASERSATGWSSQRAAVRRMTTMETTGKTSQSGVRIALGRLDESAGTNAANTTTTRPNN